MELVIIKSVLEPKDYSTLRSLLKKQQGEKITPYIFKLADPQPVEDYLSQQKIDYEIYHKKGLGTEAQKDRPGVIISNNKQNQFSGAVIMALITSQFDKVYPFEVEIEVENKQGKILTDQIYTVDKSRLGRKMGVLSTEQLKKLVLGLHVVLELGDCK
ncbi:6948_t:CDS:2 [Cetraspora pellucida]|uniref:6948_t:CDS:1 n=1 Tax=Cetraspora pellucida TaxID=1433469 RepID=A0ACA9LSQ1_9GLOM|nr:6948_t:CDS:2 [Cetraspora pellucida]